MAESSLSPKTEVAKQFKADVGRGNLLSKSEISGSPCAEHPEIIKAKPLAAPDCLALTLERRLGNFPSVIYLSNQLIHRDPNVGEKHFVEMGDAIDLTEGSNLDAGRVQIDEHARDPVSLGSVAIRTYQQDAPVTLVCQRRPYLLPVYDPAISVKLRPRREAGKVGPCGRFTKELTPDLVTAQHRPEEALLLLF